MIAGFYRLKRVPWTIIIYGRGSDILRPIIQYRNVFGISGIFIIALVIFLIRSHVVRITEKIQMLSTRATAVARGNYGDPIAVDDRDEMGMLVKRFNEMVAGLQERDQIRNSFGRYVDPEFARRLLKRPDAGALGGVRREVVVMMSDIRGFTHMAEGMSPETTVEMLNRYFSHMIAVIEAHQGIIVDFFGDGILVFFDPQVFARGNPVSLPLAVHHAFSCAVGMQQEMSLFNPADADGNRDFPPCKWASVSTPAR